MKFGYFLVFVLALVESRKRKPKPKKQPFKEEYHKGRRLSTISQELFCATCKNIYFMVTDKLFGKKDESEVYHVTENICDDMEDLSLRGYLSSSA